jgi:hypothetical protein
VERATSRSATQGLGVGKAVTVLQSPEINHPPSPKVWILGIVVALTGLGIVWLIWFTSPGINYPCIRQPKRTHVVSGQELNESNVGFQVESEGKEENAGDAAGEVPRSQSQPTVFVHHGRVKADCP